MSFFQDSIISIFTLSQYSDVLNFKNERMQNITDYFLVGWGVYFVLAFFVIVFYSERLPKLYVFLSERKAQIGLSIFLFFLGAFHIMAHNYWETGLEKIITSFGYVSIMKGFLIIIFPSSLKLSEFITRSKYFTLLLLCILFMGIAFIITALN